MALSKKPQILKDAAIDMQAAKNHRIRMRLDEENDYHLIQRLTNMYQDPITSTVREIISNGIDASVRNNSGPIDVLSPTILNTNFTVIDFGPGMSLQEIEDIYSKYGASDKSNNFNQVGAYGLGAKAALAYTDNFEVDTVSNGRRTVFKVVRTNDSNYIEILKQEKTKSTSGTKVTVPVHIRDVGAFTNAIDDYKNYSLTTPITIDGDLYNGNENYVEIGEVLLDEDLMIKGKVFIDSRARVQICNFIKKNSTEMMSIGAELFSAIYSVSKSKDQYGITNDKNKHYTIVVQVVPGLLDFDSSRENITLNYRLKEFQDKINNFMLKELSVEHLIKVLCSHYQLNQIYELASTLNLVVNSQSKETVSVNNNFYNLGGIKLSDFSNGTDNLEKLLFPAKEITSSNVFVPIVNKLMKIGHPIMHLSPDWASRSTMKEFIEFARNDLKANANLAIIKGLQASKQRVILIYGSDVKSRVRIFNYNTYLRYGDNIFSDRNVLIFTSEKIDEKQISLLQKATTDIPIVQYDVSHVLNLIKEAIPKKGKEVKTQENIPTKFMSHFTKEALLNLDNMRNWGFTRVNPQNLIDDANAILILAQDYEDAINVINGAINSHINLIGKNIYVNINPVLFDYALASSILPLKNKILISPNFKLKNNKMRELSKGRIFSDEVLNLRIQSESRQVILKREFNLLRLYGDNVPNFLKEINEVLQNNEIKSVLKEYAAIASKGDDGEKWHASLQEKHIRKIMTMSMKQDEIKAIDTIKEVLNKKVPGLSHESFSIIRGAMNRNADINSRYPFAKYAHLVVADMLTNTFNEVNSTT